MRLIIAMILIVMLSLAVSAIAATEGQVTISDMVVLTIRSDAAGMTIAQRANIVMDRVNSLMTEDPFDETKLTVSKQGQDWIISYDKQLIVTVDPASAKANKTTALALAIIWAENLKAALIAYKPIPHTTDTL